jgi:hypothetical protein
MFCQKIAWRPPKDRLRERRAFTLHSSATYYTSQFTINRSLRRLPRGEAAISFLFAVQGSYGGINLCAGVGIGWCDRGHKAVFLISGDYQEWLQPLGFETVPTISREDHLRIASHPDFTHPVRAYRE